MEINEQAKLFFKSNGSLVVECAFRTPDGVFHDIVVQDGDTPFRKDDWIGKENILIKKITKTFQTCVAQSSRTLHLSEIPEKSRFVFEKDPRPVTNRTKLFLGNAVNTNVAEYLLGYDQDINREMETLSAILLDPHCLVAPQPDLAPLPPLPPGPNNGAVEPPVVQQDRVVEPSVVQEDRVVQPRIVQQNRVVDLPVPPPIGPALNVNLEEQQRARAQAVLNDAARNALGGFWGPSCSNFC